MITLMLWLGSAVFALGIAFWVWLFRNLARPPLNQAMLFRRVPLLFLIAWNVLLVILGLWIYPNPGTIPLIGLIVGLILGWRMSR